MVEEFDSLLLVSFGGPENAAEVEPFLNRVTAGRNIPPERLAEIAHRYHSAKGFSPLNGRIRGLACRLAEELDKRSINLSVYWGNRNAPPLLAETLSAMAQAGHFHTIAWTASPYSSYSSCRQYREDLELAATEVAGPKPCVKWIRRHHDHPGLIETAADRLTEALDSLPHAARNKTALLFSAHSIPTAMAASSRYEQEIVEASRLVGERVDPTGTLQREVVWQSRSGSPTVPWLEPDITSRIRTLASEGVRAVAISPIGFPIENFEIVWDLDIEAAQAAKDSGVDFVRARTVDDDPRFVSMIIDLISERVHPEPRARSSLGKLGPTSDSCPSDCCPVASGSQ